MVRAGGRHDAQGRTLACPLVSVPIEYHSRNVLPECLRALCKYPLLEKHLAQPKSLISKTDPEVAFALFALMVCEDVSSLEGYSMSLASRPTSTA